MDFLIREWTRPDLEGLRELIMMRRDTKLIKTGNLEACTSSLALCRVNEVRVWFKELKSQPKAQGEVQGEELDLASPPCRKKTEFKTQEGKR